ncbi:MAG: hypothetical protein MJY93_11330 [Fibrobacter sp.]|nr:hypothetical protein [Fibrobacter sp.]
MSDDDQKKLKVYLDTSVICYLHQDLSMLAIVQPTVLIEHQEDEEYRLWKK